MLRRIPFWGWFAIILAGCYLTFNPTGFSVVHLWTTETGIILPLKLLLTALLATVMALCAYGTWRAIGMTGVVIIVGLVGLLLWVLQASGLSIGNGTLWMWLPQLITALVLTVGFQWPKLWRGMTGRIGVEDPDTPAA